MRMSSCLATILTLLGALTPPGLRAEGDSKIVPASQAPADDVAVQTRGPVHEAYAQPIEAAASPGPVLPKKPPDPIAELPPDQKPKGDNVQWITGYWAWDAERKDYLWVSGLWRVPPRGRKWAPGHWSEVDGGWQWAPGFWASAAQEEVPYIEEAPPASVEIGPSAPAPDDESIYVPGNWVYRTSGYAWRPGYWAVAEPGYVWTPAHYCWTPSGYCYVDGYWDYPLEDRGLLFAPVYFNSPLWLDPGWYYRPSFCVGFGGLFGSLFANPLYCHYYFGDYYSPVCISLGFSPWFSYCHHCYDPLFGYYGWTHRGDPDWYPGLVNTYRGRLAGDLPLPPRTLAQQNALVQKLNDPAANMSLAHNALNGMHLVKPLSELRGSGTQLTKLDPAQANAARKDASAYRKAGLERQRLEKPAASRTARPTALSLAPLPANASAPNLRSSGLPNDRGHRSVLSAGPQAKAIGQRPADIGNQARQDTRSPTGSPASSQFGSPRSTNQPSTPGTVHSSPGSAAGAPSRSYTRPSFDRPRYGGSLPSNGSPLRNPPSPHYQSQPSFQRSAPPQYRPPAPSYSPQRNWTPPATHQAPRMTAPAAQRSYHPAPSSRSGGSGGYSGHSFSSPAGRSSGSYGGQSSGRNGGRSSGGHSSGDWNGKH